MDMAFIISTGDTIMTKESDTQSIPVNCEKARKHTRGRRLRKDDLDNTDNQRQMNETTIY